MKILLLIFFILAGLTKNELLGADIHIPFNQNVASAVADNPVMEVRIFPNPVHDQRVNIEMTDPAIHELRITNIAGSVVYLKKFQSPVQKFQIVLENVPSGIYLLRITSDGNLTRTTKLMIRNQ
jgi:hypothetical protein